MGIVYNKNKGFWSCETIKGLNCDWNMIFGRRSNGKSYGIKEMYLKEFFEDVENNRFMYLRRYKEDIEISKVELYFADFTSIQKNGKTKLEEITKGKYNNIKCAKNRIFLTKTDEDGKEIDKIHAGYYYSINGAQSIKSLSFMDVQNIIFEEFIASQQPYLPSECERLESIISTVARFRKIKIWMVGNNDDRDCLYFKYFGLENIRKQKEGTIEIYNKFTGNFDENGEEIITKFAVEFCGNEAKKNNMFFGHGASVVNTSEWLTYRQPRLNHEYLEKCEKLYEIVVKYNGSMWFCQLFLDNTNSGLFWFVEEKTTRIKPRTRVISDEITTDPYTSHGFYSKNEKEKKAFKLLKENKVFYANDLTGTEFKRALEYFSIY